MLFVTEDAGGAGGAGGAGSAGVEEEVLFVAGGARGNVEEVFFVVEVAEGEDCEIGVVDLVDDEAAEEVFVDEEDTPAATLKFIGPL